MYSMHVNIILNACWYQLLGSESLLKVVAIQLSRICHHILKCFSSFFSLPLCLTIPHRKHNTYFSMIYVQVSHTAKLFLQTWGRLHISKPQICSYPRCVAWLIVIILATLNSTHWRHTEWHQDCIDSLAHAQCIRQHMQTTQMLNAYCIITLHTFLQNTTSQICTVCGTCSAPTQSYIMRQRCCNTCTVQSVYLSFCLIHKLKNEIQ